VKILDANPAHLFEEPVAKIRRHVIEPMVKGRAQIVIDYPRGTDDCIRRPTRCPLLRSTFQPVTLMPLSDSDDAIRQLVGER
jgi:hypothetical protein